MYIKRRKVLNLLPYLLAGGFVYPVTNFLFFDYSSNKKLSIKLKDIKQSMTYIKESQIFIQNNNGNIRIFDAHCTHMGCILKYDSSIQEFKCPCHKSRFDIDGTKLKGPAKRDLDRIPYKIKNNILYIG